MLHQKVDRLGHKEFVADEALPAGRVHVEHQLVAVAADKLGLTPMYLICKPKTETTVQTASAAGTSARTANPMTTYQNLQQQRVKLLAQMTPDQRMAAMRQEMMAMREQFGQMGGGPGGWGGRRHQDH